MAAGSVTTTGLREMRAASNRLPDELTAALRRVAQRTAQRVQAGARARVAVATGWTREHIALRESPADKAFIVSAGTDRPRVGIAWHTRRSGRSHTQRVTLNMLPSWLEYGTVHMTARPFMRPSTEAERASYVRDMRRETLRVAREVLQA